MRDRSSCMVMVARVRQRITLSRSIYASTCDCDRAGGQRESHKHQKLTVKTQPTSVVSLTSWLSVSSRVWNSAMRFCDKRRRSDRACNGASLDEGGRWALFFTSRRVVWQRFGQVSSGSAHR